MVVVSELRDVLADPSHLPKLLRVPVPTHIRIVRELRKKGGKRAVKIKEEKLRNNNYQIKRGVVFKT